jgi:hypothetical protein
MRANVRVLIYIIRSSCNLCNVACRSSTALYTMVVLRHVHGYTLAPSYNYIGYQTKNIREVMSEICKFCNSHLLNKFSRPVYKINSKTMITSYIPYNLCCCLFAEHMQISLNIYPYQVKDLKPR